MTVKVQGERWFPSEVHFGAEIKELWGDWYCDSEVGTLRAVLMHRPGPEIEGITAENYPQYRFRGPINAAKARQEHDALTDIYSSHGVEVHFVEGQRTDRPNAMFLRDLVFMTPEGAIVCRPALAVRRGEERAVAYTLAKLGVPILKTINGDGYFEGACALWVDRETVIIGTSSRTNEAGLRQVENELRTIGVTDIVRTQIPFGSIHLDGYLNMVDKDKCLVFPWHLAYDCAKFLMTKGITLIEATDIHEVKHGLAVNVVALRPGKIVMPAGNPNTKRILQANGVEVVEAELTELMNGWGSIHCSTVFLRRDPLALC